jgi:hypothetical protein
MTSINALKAAYDAAQHDAEHSPCPDASDAASEAVSSIGEQLLSEAAATAADLDAKLRVFEDLWLAPVLGSTPFNDLFRKDMRAAWQGILSDAGRIATPSA